MTIQDNSHLNGKQKNGDHKVNPQLANTNDSNSEPQSKGEPSKGYQDNGSIKRPYRSNYNKLFRTIKITMYSKMNAAERLLLKYRFVQSINIYYSSLSVVLGIITLTVNDIKNLSVYSVILSIVLALSILYQNAQNYLERSQALNRCYFQLKRLLEQIAHEETFNLQLKKKYELEYISIIENVENHMQFDYYATLVREKIHAKKDMAKAYTMYYSHKILSFFLTVLFYSVPLIIAIIIIADKFPFLKFWIRGH